MSHYWDMIEHLCIAIAILGAAITYIVKGIRGVKAPADDFAAKLDNDNRRLKELEEERDYISHSISLLMKSNLVILGHLSTNNNKGEMKKMQDEMREFLINN